MRFFNVGLKPHTQVKEEMDRFMRDVAPAFEGAHKRRVAQTTRLLRGYPGVLTVSDCGPPSPVAGRGGLWIVRWPPVIHGPFTSETLD